MRAGSLQCGLLNGSTNLIKTINNMINENGTQVKAARSRAYKYKSGVLAKTEKVNWAKLAKLADQGLKRVEAKYGRYVEPQRIYAPARDCV